jgi:hypothetical protein
MDPRLEYIEAWLPVIGFEGSYEVSNLGRVRSLPRKVASRPGRIRRVPGKLLKPNFTIHGYLQVNLQRESKGVPFSVHRLVAEAFIGPRPPGADIDHKDGIKINNERWNLEYVSRLENVRRAIRMGLVAPNPPGEKHPAARLRDADIIEIRRLNLEGMSRKAIGIQFGISRSHVGRIVNRKRRTHNSEGQELQS